VVSSGSIWLLFSRRTIYREVDEPNVRDYYPPASTPRYSHRNSLLPRLEPSPLRYTQPAYSIAPRPRENQFAVRACIHQRRLHGGAHLQVEHLVVVHSRLRVYERGDHRLVVARGLGGLVDGDGLPECLRESLPGEGSSASDADLCTQLSEDVCIRGGRLGEGERHGLEVGRGVIRRAAEAQALLVPPLARGQRVVQVMAGLGGPRAS